MIANTRYFARFTSIPLIAIAILLLTTFPGWHEEEDSDGTEVEVKRFPSKPISYVVLVVLTIVSLLTFVSVLWQHITSSAAATMGQSLSYGTVEGHVGTVAMVLGWGAVLCNLIAALGILIMVVSINLLAAIF